MGVNVPVVFMKVLLFLFPCGFHVWGCCIEVFEACDRSNSVFFFSFSFYFCWQLISLAPQSVVVDFV